VIKREQPPDSEGLTRVDHWQPERTHPVGQGTDWIGLWQHKSHAS
jgi:hypothetical protein